MLKYGLIFGALLVVFTGCAHRRISPTFMLVDVATNTPLQKATVYQFKPELQPANPGFIPVVVALPDPDPNQTPKTNAQGRVAFTDVDADRPFGAEAVGYERIGWKIQSDGRAYIHRWHSYELFITKDTSGLYTIPVWPVPKYEMNPTH